MTEHQEQCLFVQWFRLQFPSVRIMAIPNGTRTSMGAAVKAKREGVSKGVPDLFIAQWKLWIEMKKETGGTVSKEQREWMEYLEGCGYSCFVARGFKDAKIQTIAFLDSM